MAGCHVLKHSQGPRDLKHGFIAFHNTRRQVKGKSYGTCFHYGNHANTGNKRREGQCKRKLETKLNLLFVTRTGWGAGRPRALLLAVSGTTDLHFLSLSAWSTQSIQTSKVDHLRLVKDDFILSAVKSARPPH